MTLFILIDHRVRLACGTSDPDTYLVNTDEEIAQARAALRDAGIDEAPVWAGEPDEGESVKTWMSILAAT